MKTPQEILDQVANNTHGQDFSLCCFDGKYDLEDMALQAIEDYALQFSKVDTNVEYDPNITLPDVSNIGESCNPYYLVKTANFGWQKAMYCHDGWYLSYISKLTVPVIKWKESAN